MAKAANREGVSFQVRRDDWSECRTVPVRVTDSLDTGEVLFRVDRFAFTSNNISYASAGDMLAYWKFFPAEDPWGRIPTMGFGDVITSRHPDVREGERLFGFFPMATHLVVQADKVGPSGFVDGVEHRREHAPAYRQYSRVSDDPMYDVASEDQTLLLRGLFMTSFLVDDMLADNDDFGARVFVISSASSKTGLALAHQLKQRGVGPVIGLTSERNRAFVESLGTYDRAVLYGDIESLATDTPIVFVDHAGDGDVVNRVHRHFGDNVRYSCLVGATHWDATARDTKLPGAEPTFFFAPGQIQKRSQEWGPGELQSRLGGAWTGFRDASASWLHVQRHYGPKAVERAYREVLEGRASPSEGHVLSLWDEGS